MHGCNSIEVVNTLTIYITIFLSVKMAGFFFDIKEKQNIYFVVFIHQSTKISFEDPIKYRHFQQN